MLRPDLECSIVQALSLERVHATIRHEKISLRGIVEAGPVEVVAEANDWEEAFAGTLARQQRYAIWSQLEGGGYVLPGYTP
ncbi:hypothetical protein ACFVSU_02630 [Microbacterium sp. NPDC058062]|uniref:hypothetical protein n=1 Tax=Microbacterium sp. NPDC058062 TaxID=3346320 RepID=UPI0036D84729